MNYILIIFILYLFIYNPVFSFLGGLGSVKLLYPFIIIFLITQKKTIYGVLRLFKTERNYFIAFMAFAFLRFGIGGDPVEFYRHIILFIENFVIPIILIAGCRKYFKIYDQKVIKIVLTLGSVAAIISTLCFLNPQIQDFVKTRLQTWGSGGYLADVDYRGFGLGESLTYSYGIIQGFILGLGVINIRNNKWFILFVPLFLVSILFNARTGIFISVISIVVYLLTNRGYKKLLYTLLGTSVAYLIIVFSIQRYGIDDDQLFFYNDFVKQLTEVEEVGVDNSAGTAGYLATDHVIWPSDFSEWIFGRGYILYGIRGARNTDSGFFQQLNYGGLIYMALMFFFIIFLLKRMLALKIPIDFILLFVAALVIAHIKGNLIMNSGAFRLMMFLYYSLVISKITMKSKAKLIA